MGRPAAVRGIRRASPRVDVMYEVLVKAGHFGLVVGSTALTVTWPSVVEWMRWREGDGAPPARAIDVRHEVPAAAPDGDNLLVITYNGVRTQANVFVTVKK